MRPFSRRKNILYVEKIMNFKLESVIPWGRSMQEYVRMFDLKSDELHLKIIDCAGGPASFNFEMNRRRNQSGALRVSKRWQLRVRQQ